MLSQVASFGRKQLSDVGVRLNIVQASLKEVDYDGSGELEIEAARCEYGMLSWLNIVWVGYMYGVEGGSMPCP